ncbi:MAG: hypothetical protein LBP63_04275 [Prevotellaceae bacterium]|nr:hypothetical protein [Prevotellaceae bacterium]
MKNKKFEITKFETLEDSNEMLKGGFSSVYTAGNQTTGINFAKGCGCTNPGCNVVKGCACRPDKDIIKTE